jgi:23S rRNA (guanosine2251-2'-O)-methyltransferase
MIIIKGKRAVLEALRGKGQVESVVVSVKSQYKPEIKAIIQKAKVCNVNLQIIPEDRFEEILPGQTNTQGIIAYQKASKEKTLNDVIKAKENYPFIIAIDHLQDPYNFGAILRTCEILGVKAVVYPKDRNCQITPGVIKASSGAISHLDMIKVVNLAQAIKTLDSNGYWIYGADSNAGVSLNEIKVQAPIVLVVGNEQKGISTRVSSMLHSSINIPATGKTQSLNVSVATGIITYVLSQQL